MSKEDNPFEKFDPTRMEHYTSHDPITKVVHIETELMLVDLVTCAKASGETKEDFLKLCKEVWDNLEVTMTQDRTKMS